MNEGAGTSFLQKLRELFLRKYPWQIHFFNETVTAGEMAEAARFLVSGSPLQEGKACEQYSTAFARSLGGDGEAFLFGSGRMALYAILEALGIGPGDEVVLPAFTCEVVVHALLYRGITPVYADIDPFTFNANGAAIERVITDKTRCVIVQHTFGVPCDMEPILDLALRRRLYVIEDCAIALGSTYRGRQVGTFGHASFFSTDRSKLLSTQWGGVAYTSRQEIASRLRAYYEHVGHLRTGQIRNIATHSILSHLLLSPYVYWAGRYLYNAGLRSGLFFSHKDDTVRFRLPENYPCRLSNFQAFVGLGQLTKLEATLEHRKRTVRAYANILRNNGILLDASRRALGDTTLRFSLLLKNREQFVRKWNRYFEVGKWFDSPAFGWSGSPDTIGYRPGTCPIAEFVHRHIVNFPTHQTSPRMRRFLETVVSRIRKEDVMMDDELEELVSDVDSRARNSTSAAR